MLYALQNQPRPTLLLVGNFGYVFLQSVAAVSDSAFPHVPVV